MAYFPYTQGTGASPTLQVELRTKGDPEALLPSVERVIHEMDPNIPLEKPMSQAAVFEDSYARQRLFSRLAMFFGLLAALLVAIGPLKDFLWQRYSLTHSFQSLPVCCSVIGPDGED
jgi:hypothetical protein